MPRAVKGQRFGGRTKGTPNKVTADQRAAIHEAFEKLGGVTALKQWGEKDQAGFYRLWGSIIPKAIEGPGDDGELVIRVKIEEGRPVDR